MSFLKKKRGVLNLLNLSGPSESVSSSAPSDDNVDESLQENIAQASEENPIENEADESMAASDVADAAQPNEDETSVLSAEQVADESSHSDSATGVKIIRPLIRIFASRQSQTEEAAKPYSEPEEPKSSNPFDQVVQAEISLEASDSQSETVVAETNGDEVVFDPIGPTIEEEIVSSIDESEAGVAEPFVAVNPFDQVISSEAGTPAEGDVHGENDEGVVFVSPFSQTTSNEDADSHEDSEPHVIIRPLGSSSSDHSQEEDEESEITIQALSGSDEAAQSDPDEETPQEFQPIQEVAENQSQGDEEPGLGFVILKRTPSSESGSIGEGENEHLNEAHLDSDISESGSQVGEVSASGENGESVSEEESDDTSIAVRSTLQKKYTPEELREFAQYLPKTIASRYEAIILNSWTTGFNTRQFEVGLVHIKNGDHRNGVLRSLKVSPLDVKFVPLDEEVFKYLHESIYDPKAAVEAIIQEQKKQSQKTKAWGEGQSTLSPEEAFAIQAAEVEFDIGSEEWMDLTNTEEYERNIKRNEAELTTQEFIRLILMEFLRSGSSDMHIESGQPTGRIRFRYDSEMFTRWDDIPFVKIRQIAAGLAETAGKDATRMKFKDIDSTIKVKALRDGVPADVELRFASQPTLYSPSIVLRSQLKPIRDINVVGFLPSQVEDLETAYSQKRGIIVVTGATGSGKTNTLESIYAKLEETDKFKIIEIGEPIEIRSGRRTQISLRPNTPFTWWDAFYSCLRSDPDIIGIGELRSAEHLSVAINAALTGHLVLSTFHAASVEDTLTRMFQMGIPRENLATGINLILAQTLIKRLCEKCKVVDETASEQYGKTVYKSAGCPECFNKGTRGRTAMAELLYFNDEVKQWIQDKNMSARDVVQRATREGHLLPMKIVAREKVLAGLASTHETAGALGYLESSESWNNGSAFHFSEDSDRPHTQEISPGDIPVVEDFIEGEIVED